MTMRKVLGTALAAAAFCLLGALFFFTYSSMKEQRRQKTCVGVKVEFADPYTFVTPEDVEQYLKEGYGAYVGQRLDSIDLLKVEKVLDGKSAIMKTDAFTTPDGYLNIRLFQREPVVRFQKGGYGFYADSEGFLFPLQNNYTSRVPIIDGEIPLEVKAGFKGRPKSDKENEWLSGAIELANYISSSATWSENISQISVRPNGDLVMVPRQGKEKFIFGKLDDIPGKFWKMEKYYTSIAPAREPGYYSSVNVKYKGQIVCRK